MSSIKKSLSIAAVLAIAFTLVPASITPAGGLEVDELCASSACKRQAGAWCMYGGEPVYGYKTVIG